MDWDIIHGDCLKELGALDAASIDAVVTDPPYELGFMGKKWDASGIAYSVELWREVLRVLKPGGHMLAFGGSRTYHRMACAIEDAGFEVRDSIHWIYGSGFPKSHNISKAIDKDAGAEREVIGVASGAVNPNGYKTDGVTQSGGAYKSEYNVTAPATDSAKQWAGWGTALKPAHEPVVLARKPLIGTVAANVLEHGTGALNIDACRVEGKLDGDPNRFAKTNGGEFVAAFSKAPPIVRAEGRWPANLILDEAAAEALDAQSLAGGMHSAGKARDGSTAKVADGYSASSYELPPDRNMRRLGDSGGASRFFYVAKPTAGERDNGIHHLRKRPAAELVNRADGSAGMDSPRAGAGRTSRGRANTHATVKPVELMRYLCRLITPPGGLVLDPFTGSGTTGVAALQEGFRFIGIEREEEYVTIAKARIEEDMPLFSRARP